MIKKLALITFIGMMFTSCGMLKSYTAKYDVSLASVESPADAKAQFGETKVATRGRLYRHRLVCVNETVQLHPEKQIEPYHQDQLG